MLTLHCGAPSRRVTDPSLIMLAGLQVNRVNARFVISVEQGFVTTGVSELVVEPGETVNLSTVPLGGPLANLESAFLAAVRVNITECLETKAEATADIEAISWVKWGIGAMSTRTATPLLPQGQ